MDLEKSFTEDLPQWFNLNNYCSFNQMSYKDLAMQLHYRLHASMIMNMGAPDYVDLIFKDGVIIPESKSAKKYSSWVSELRASGNNLSRSLAIKPIDRSELSWMAIQREGNSVDSNMPNTSMVLLEKHRNSESVGDRITLRSEDIMELMRNDIEKFHRIEHESIDLLLPKSSNVHVAIDLSMPDRFIMEGLKRLLSDWRKQLGISAPNPKLKSSLVKLRSNFINYRAFQIIDLKLWASSQGVNYRESYLHSVIFPDGDKTLNLDDFRKKAIPFADDALDPRLPSAMLDMCATEEKMMKNSSEE